MISQIIIDVEVKLEPEGKFYYFIFAILINTQTKEEGLRSITTIQTL